MKTPRNLITILILCSLLSGCCNDCKREDKSNMVMNTEIKKNWEQQFDDILPLLGHRNWILVVDKAFPLQSAAGMTYIDTRRNLPEVLETVVSKIKGASHVQGIYYTDTELNYLNEELVAGIGDFRKNLQETLSGNTTQPLNHNDIFQRLDAASKLFNVVVLKTEQVMPYTSVFIELDCGYWSADKEARLRDLIKPVQ